MSGPRNMVAGRVPASGDLVWLNSTPQSGREEAGRRLALVHSPAKYNDASGLMLVCPITSKVKGYPFEVRRPDGGEFQGVVLSDQIRGLDWRARSCSVIGPADESVIEEVRAKVSVLVGG